MSQTYVLSRTVAAFDYASVENIINMMKATFHGSLFMIDLILEDGDLKHLCPVRPASVPGELMHGEFGDHYTEDYAFVPRGSCHELQSDINTIRLARLVDGVMPEDSAVDLAGCVAGAISESRRFDQQSLEL